MASNKSIVKRADGRKRRRMTVYLPPDTHRRLAVHCAQTDRDLSDVIGEVLAERFGGGK